MVSFVNVPQKGNFFEAIHTPIHIKSPIVISVGGALISLLNGPNREFLQELNTLIRAEVSHHKRFMLIAGGGAVCRQYRDAGKDVISAMTDDDLDWIGIHATRLNGHLLRTIFKDISHPRMIENYYHKLENWHEPIVIGAGWKPGHSSDYCAVHLAVEYGASTIINLTNVDYVFDKDPKLHKDAQALKDITWAKMQELIGDEWVPGMNSPFDPIASKLAAKHDLNVIIANGTQLHNLRNILSGESFKGTVIHP